MAVRGGTIALCPSQHGVIDHPVIVIAVRFDMCGACGGGKGEGSNR